MRLALALPILLAACATVQTAPVPGSGSEYDSPPAAAHASRSFSVTRNPDPLAALGETFRIEWE